MCDKCRIFRINELEHERDIDHGRIAALESQLAAAQEDKVQILREFTEWRGSQVSENAALRAENDTIVDEAHQCHEQNGRLVTEHMALRAEVSRLTERLEKVRPYVSLVANSCYFSPAISHGAYEWLKGKP